MTTEANPWVTRPPDEEVLTEAAPPPVPAPALTGPSTPQDGVRLPEAQRLLPTVTHSARADLWVVGVHGGAGESSLADLVPQWAEAGHGWPRLDDGSRARAVLAARSSMRGLLAAQSAATQWAAGTVPYVELLGLVVVADSSGRLPRPLRELAQVVGGGVPRTWSVPWIESWRLGETPTLSDAPRAVRRLVDDLKTLVDRSTDHSTTN